MGTHGYAAPEYVMTGKIIFIYIYISMNINQDLEFDINLGKEINGSETLLFFIQVT